MNFIKGLAVGLLKRSIAPLLNAEIDSLANNLKKEIGIRGPKAIDSVIDAAQARAITLVRTKGPTWAFMLPIRDQVASAIQVFGDQVQEKLDAEVSAHGDQAVDLAVAQAKTLLLAKIDAISL